MPAQQPDGDLLLGSRAIHTFLVQLGMPESANFYYLYYLKRAGRWPIGNTGGGNCGGRLIASKRRLIEHIDKITRSSPPLGRNRIVTKFRFDRHTKKNIATAPPIRRRKQVLRPATRPKRRVRTDQLPAE
jgi:hypothetical protein